MKIKNLLILVLFLNNFCFQVYSAGLLPRFASLKAAEVNLHVGPSLNYPTIWKFVRKNLPVEIIAEFDTWRMIRDWQGTEGWVHKSLLTGKRTVSVINGIQSIYQKPDPNSKLVATLEVGVIGHMLECYGQWCRIEVRDDKSNKYRGWINKQHVWGIHHNENKI
jgi:SH3-like domain-containing protein